MGSTVGNNTSGYGSKRNIKSKRPCHLAVYKTEKSDPGKMQPCTLISKICTYVYIDIDVKKFTVMCLLYQEL